VSARALELTASANEAVKALITPALKNFFILLSLHYHVGELARNMKQGLASVAQAADRA
jgi:hypothetical protein